MATGVVVNLNRLAVIHRTGEIISRDFAGIDLIKFHRLLLSKRTYKRTYEHACLKSALGANSIPQGSHTHDPNIFATTTPWP